MEAERKQPACEILCAHAPRPAAPRERGCELGPPLLGHFTRGSHRGGLSMVPRWCYRVMMRIRSLVRGRALDRELDEELQFHVDQLVQSNLARGLSPDAARREALLAIGGIEQRKEECRDTRRVRLVEDLVQDLRYGVRTLRRAPGFTTAAVLTLTLGIGTSVAMFTVVNGVLMRPLPFPEPERLHLVSLSPKSMLMAQPGMVDRTYVAFREADRTFQNLAAFTHYNGN